jgi:hypothetical protein
MKILLVFAAVAALSSGGHDINSDETRTSSKLFGYKINVDPELQQPPLDATLQTKKWNAW